MVVGRSILSSWLLFLFHIVPEPTDRPALVFSGCFKAGTQKQPGERTFEPWNNHVLSSPSPRSSYWVSPPWFSISRAWLSDSQCPDGESRGDGGGACRPEEKCWGESKNYGKVSIFSDIWNIKFENVWKTSPGSNMNISECPCLPLTTQSSRQLVLEELKQ